MNNVLIVAAREFAQIARLRSFWLTLLSLPLIVVIVPAAQSIMRSDAPSRLLIIDQAGGAAAQAIEQQLRLKHQREVLEDLASHVRRHGLDRGKAVVPWSWTDHWFTDAEVAQFSAAGGAPAVLARMAADTPAQTPEFEPPVSDYEIVEATATLASLTGAALEEKIEEQLAPPDGSSPRADHVLQIPAEFPAQGLARFWSGNRLDGYLVSTAQDVLTRALRHDLLVAGGVPEDTVRAASTVAATLSVSRPPPGRGISDSMVIRSLLPVAVSYLLAMSLMLSGSWMLQGAIEERSGKLLETVVAAVSPEGLMYGKLLGTLGIGLVMVVVWIGCGAIGAFAMKGPIADIIRPALAPLTSVGTITAIVYFFLAGYVAISVFFLAIGAVSDSMNDAQGYLMPVVLALIMPIGIIPNSILSGGESLGLTILTWIPIWTPLAVLARLGTGIPTWEVLGSGLLLAAFIAAELLLLGRLFRASLLAQGQKPGIAELVRRLRAPVD